MNRAQITTVIFGLENRELMPRWLESLKVVCGGSTDKANQYNLILQMFYTKKDKQDGLNYHIKLSSLETIVPMIYQWLAGLEKKPDISKILLEGILEELDIRQDNHNNYLFRA